MVILFETQHNPQTGFLWGGLEGIILCFIIVFYLWAYGMLCTFVVRIYGQYKVRRAGNTYLVQCNVVLMSFFTSIPILITTSIKKWLSRPRFRSEMLRVVEDEVEAVEVEGFSPNHDHPGEGAVKPIITSLGKLSGPIRPALTLRPIRPS